MKFIFYFLVSIVFSGCIMHNGPKDIYFNEIEQLKNISGLYKNNHMLSYLIFGATINASLDNKVDFINISTKNDTVLVEAINKKCVIYKQEYVLNKDFQIEDGKITLKREFYLLSRGSGDVTVGPSYETIEIGLDQNNNGMYRHQERLAVLAIFIIPIVASDTYQLSFERVDDANKYSTCITH